jgi:hypothetical protein
LLAACATTNSTGNLAPGERPDPASDEAGLWMAVDNIERQLASSGRTVRDTRLNAYVREVLCRVAPEHCADVRVYIMEVPYFNASMYPNGAMQVWTGLLLRAENEAQFAYVVGHELGHYLRRHSLQQWRSVRNTQNALVFLQIATSAAGAGYVGDLSQVVAAAALLAYNRDQEREADDIGFELLVVAEYPPEQAALSWENLLQERRASGDEAPPVFLSTHPGAEERVQTLRNLALITPPPPGGGDAGTERFRAETARFRSRWLAGELEKRDYDGFQVLVARLLRGDPESGELRFYSGEMHRLRAGPGDLEAAIEDYRLAMGAGDAPVAVHRSAALCYWKLGHIAEARAAFQTYLSLDPEAVDREMIQAYVEQLQ